MTDKAINGHHDTTRAGDDETATHQHEMQSEASPGASGGGKPMTLADTKVPDLLARIASRIAENEEIASERDTFGAMKARLETLKQQANDARATADSDGGNDTNAQAGARKGDTRGTFAGVEAALAKLASQVDDAAKQHTEPGVAEWNDEVAEELTAHCEDEGLTGRGRRADLLIGNSGAKGDGAPVNYVYLQPSTQEIGQQWFEERFEALASRFDAMSFGDTGSGAVAGAGLGALIAKFDALEARFGTLFGYPAADGEAPTGGSLNDIEMCIAEIAAQLEATTAELQRIDGIERQIGEIAQNLATGGIAGGGPGAFDMAALADQIAARIGDRPMAFAERGAGIGEADGADLASVMKEFMREQRAEGEHANAVLDTMQQSIIRVLDRMEALEGGGQGRTSAPQHQPSQKAPAATCEPVAAARPTYTRDIPAAGHAADDADERSLDRLQRVVGELENTIPAARAEAPTPAAEAGPAKPAAQRIRAEFIAAAREAAALAAARPDPDATPEKVETERSRFAAAARKAAAKAGLRSAATEADGDWDDDIDMLDGGFTPGAGDMRPAPVKKNNTRARLLIAAVALLFVGIGATKYYISQTGNTGDTIRSDKVQQGSSIAGEKATAQAAATKVSSLPGEGVAPALKVAAQPPLDTAAAPIVTSSTDGTLVQRAAVPPTFEAAAPAPVSGEVGGVQRQALPSALVGPLSLRIAAANGDPSAEFQVGARFADGQGVEQNFGEAIKWYQRSAGRGFALAQYRLGTLYERGLGVTKDAQRARVWYERAAAKDNVKSMHNIAVLAASPVNGKPDYETAAKWFNQAAERGLGDSQFNLAILYQNGLGVAQDDALAYKWFSLAAATGDGEAAKRKKGVAVTLGKDRAGEIDAELRGWMRKPANRMANDPHYAGQAWQRS